MFYETQKNNHALSHDPFKSCIIPRPIGWISSLNENGSINLAPYSFFNAVSENPHMIMFSSQTRAHDANDKDTITNVERDKEFVVNITPYNLHKQMNITATEFEKNISEVKKAQLKTLPSKLIKTPRIEGAPIHLECTYYQSIQLPANENNHAYRIVLAHVIAIHIDDNIIRNGKIEASLFKPIARLGDMKYTVVEEHNIFELQRLPPEFYK